MSLLQRFKCWQRNVCYKHQNPTDRWGDCDMCDREWRNKLVARQQNLVADLKRDRGICTREAYHDGPCNGLPSVTCYVYGK